MFLVGQGLNRALTASAFRLSSLLLSLRLQLSPPLSGPLLLLMLLYGKGYSGVLVSVTYLCSAGEWIQGPVHTRPALPWSYPASSLPSMSNFSHRSVHIVFGTKAVHFCGGRGQMMPCSKLSVCQQVQLDSGSGQLHCLSIDLGQLSAQRSFPSTWPS